MVAKFFIILALVAVASAGDYSNFAYSVADPYTGDFKNQVESRLGDNVKGQYSLLESDGTRRTVDYAAGAEGFNAVVRKDPALLAAAPLISTPYAYAAPYGLPYYAKFGALPYNGYFPYNYKGILY
ncbi:cuticular protein RR-2 motif 64 precursor [Bombyx mori]|uniref:Putative cuticle protein n=1 Tax=Bombyx mori TaxID=7091 RepID=C0H6Q6_BOMMO|nr:cuticular protein RR-2 motif 64 precursor [Bombyx mori]FAA00567.1 TPA: putative cuticle protein [Bombyx mori]